MRTTHALICTSDVHTVAGALPVQPGVTLGHEALGVVHARGSNVSGFTEGQRVAVNAVTPCYQCRYCQTGYTSQCRGPLGGYQCSAQRDGNMAEYFMVPHAMANLAPIPYAVSSEAAVCGCDMLSTGFMGAEHWYLRLGDSVAIFAQGAVGLSATIGATLLGATLLGAARIFAVESIPNRQRLAQAYRRHHSPDAAPRRQRVSGRPADGRDQPGRQASSCCSVSTTASTRAWGGRWRCPRP